MTQTFIAISQDGELEFSDPERLRQFLIYNPGELFINVAQRKKTRSLKQNAYGYGVVIKELSEYTGHTPQQLKEYVKRELGLVEVITLPNGKITEVTRSSATFTTVEWENYMKFFRQLGDENGIFIPEPNGVNYA